MISHRSIRLSQLLGLMMILLPIGALAQQFVGQPVTPKSAQISKQLSSWEIYRIDATELTNTVRQDVITDNFSTVTLDLGAHHWPLQLMVNPIIDAGYQCKVITETGTTILEPTGHKAFKGTNLIGSGRVRLTLDTDFIYGIVIENEEMWYIEPLWYMDPAADHDLYIVYPRSAVNREVDGTCATVEADNMIRRAEQQIMEEHAHEGAESMLACYQLDLAIASDNSMLQKYGSASAVQNHNIGVINDVEVDYTGSFNHDIAFNIVIQIVSSTDPWGANANAGTYLGNFRTWGNAGGFGIAFDLGELWTNIDFTGTTIGIAYVGGLCSSFKYHCLQDFSGNAELLRCMTSHEIGHNFNCQHDGTGTCPPNFIMCPFVSTSNEWSGTSVGAVNSFIVPLISNGCLSPCSSGPPPVPSFSWTPDPGCVGQPVQFTDESTGTISTRTWTFPGGTPATSTQMNPTVTWNTAGVKNVTLTLNTGTAISATISKQVTILGTPTANFTSTVNGLTVTFNNTSTNATTYEWDFGDGYGSSEQNPVHIYDIGGFYSVKLTVTGPCGTANKTININTAPSPDFEASPLSGCAPLFVQFANLSTSNATSYSWSFPGGTPVASNLTNPAVTYFTPGVYTVTLSAFNAAGSLTLSRTGYITVLGIPSPNFTSSANGLTVTFTSTSANATTYDWNFGDGNTSTATNPVHTYATGGVYTVTLQTTNTCGNAQIEKNVVLISPPTPSFTAAPTEGCGPLTVQFTSTTTGNPTGYAWQFPGGLPATSTTQNPNVIYNTPGTYSVTLTATNAAGSSTTTQTNLIVVNGPPTAAYTYATNGFQANFTNITAPGTAPNPNTYLWNFGEPASGAANTSTQTNPSHLYATPGTYTVTLTATNNCGSTTATQTVTIVQSPTASFTANPTTGCGQLTVQFNSTSAGSPTSLLWQFPGGTPSSSTSANPTVTYSTPGLYSVTLTATNGAGSGSTTQTNLVNVATTPVAAFNGTVNGATATFNNNSSSATTYAWAFGDGNSSSSANPSHTYLADGIYNVVLTATNACGTSTATQTVTIVTPPTAGFNVSGPTNGCAPFSVTFNNTSSANASTFAWEFPGGTPATSNAQNPTVSYANPGTYSVTLVSGNSGGSATATQTNLITVGIAPAAAFTGSVTGVTATFSNTSTGATSYNWTFGDGGVSTTENPSHTYTADGVYTVVLTATNTCGSVTATQTVTIVTPPTANFGVNGPANGCAPFTVTFNNTSSANSASYLWQFPGGVPASSTEQNPTVIYSAAGVYSVVLTSINAAGAATATQANYITVSNAPLAAFTSNAAGAQISFNNTSTSATSYNWNFGDGNNSTAENPVHTYTNDGSYTVVLTATNACGVNTTTQTLNIVTPPTANFGAIGATSGCAPFSVTFNNTSSANATTFLWVFPGGDPSVSTETNPTVVYSTPGTYSVTLNASNSAGNANTTQTNFVTVGSQPNSVFSSSINGSSVLFVNASTSATAFVWTFGDGNNSTAPEPTHVYANDGTYIVTLIATNACGSSTSTDTVTIVTPPLPGFFANNTLGCAPLTVQYTNTSSANTTAVFWEFPGGTPATSTAQNPTVVYSTPGVFAVSLTATNAAGSATGTQNNLVTVTTTPTADFAVQTAGLGVVLTNNSTNATSYLWEFSDGQTSTDENPTHDYGATGTYTIVLHATNFCGTTTFSTEVTISGAAPLPAFSTGEDSTGCAPFVIAFADLSAGNPTAWKWTFEGGNPAASTDQNPSVTYAVPGIYDVVLEVTNAFGSNTLTATNSVYVQAAPTSAAFTYLPQGATVQFTNQTPGNFNYAWSFGDGSVSTEANPTHTYTQTGNYVVQLVVSNECGEIAIQETISVEVIGTFDLNWIAGMRLYPNPNTGVFTLELKGTPQDELELTFVNTLGQCARREVVAFDQGNLVKTFQYTDLPTGVYTLNIRGGQHAVVLKVVISR